jgi:hypothetical protein
MDLGIANDGEHYKTMPLICTLLPFTRLQPAFRLSLIGAHTPHDERQISWEDPYVAI